jgi:enoyl-CoA hydratase/carnithine racemase
VPPDRLDEEISALADSIKDKPPAVSAAGKKLFYEQLESRLTNAYHIASIAITDNMLGEDAAEGVGAFIEKRKPAWRAR